MLLPAAETQSGLEEGDVPLGHRNIYLFADDEALADLTLTDLRPSGNDQDRLSSRSDLDQWLEDLVGKYGPVMLVPHHPAAWNPQPTDWSCHPDLYEVAVEIHSNKGNSLGWELDYDTTEPEYAAGTVHAAMDPDGWGHHLGFWAGSDQHRTIPGDLCNPEDMLGRYTGGLTIAAIPAGQPFDRLSLHQALLTHRTLATSGPMLPVVISYSVEGVEIGGLGEDLAIAEGDDLDIEVRIPEEHEFAAHHVLLVHHGGAITMDADGGGRWSTQLDHQELPRWVYPAIFLNGQNWYGDAQCNDGGDDAGEVVWGSPSWIGLSAEDDDGDGYSEDEGDCHDWSASIHPGAADIAYDGIDQDCDGRSDFDRDGDGFDATWLGGDDCDDGDPTLNLRCEEPPFPGFRCGLTAGPPPRSWLLLVAPLMVARRRRRHSVLAS